MTRGWSRPRNGCGSWIGSRPSRAFGSAMRTKIFSAPLARAWADRPPEAECLGNPAFHRLFLAPRQLKPRLIVKGSGIDWLSVSAEWEQEGLKLTAADLQRLQAATGRFVKLPDSGWVELDTDAVQSAHEAMADLGVDGLVPVAQKIGLEQAAHLDEEGLKRFADSPQAQGLARERLKNFKGVPATELARHACRPNCGRIRRTGSISSAISRKSGSAAFWPTTWASAKRLQTLTWLAWLQEQQYARIPSPRW